MATKENNPHVTDQSPSKDWFLQFLVNLANKNQFELDITLTVGGLPISGTLVGVRKYFTELSDYFADSLEAGSDPEVIKETFRKIGDQCSCVSPSEQTDTPSYIHLRDARFLNVDGSSAAEAPGGWWRGRLSEVQGFTPGK